MGIPFNKIPSGDDLTDRIQQNIQSAFAAIPDAQKPNVVTVSSNYKVTGAEDVLHCDAQSGPIRITLPAPSASNRPIQIKQINLQTSKSSVNTVTVCSADGSKTIAGQSSYTLDSSGTGSVSITADNTQHWPAATAGGNPPVSPTPVPSPPFIDTGVQSVTGATAGLVDNHDPKNPIILPQPSNPPFEGYAVQYVHPDGANSNDGTLNFPKKTKSAAYIALMPLGGGQIFSATGAVWSDGSETYTDHNGPHTLTAGVGARFTGWIQGPTRPDFLPIVPIVWSAWGTDTLVNFGVPGAKWRHGNAATADRTDCALWYGPKCFSGHQFNSFAFESNLALRQGWDYRRNDDVNASIAWANITNAVRTAGVDTQHTSSVFTVDFPQAWNIIGFGRAAGLVTIEVDMPLQPAWPPVFEGMWVRVNSVTAGFASLDVTTKDGGTQNVANPPGAQHILFTYLQAGLDVAFVPVAPGGTVQSHCLKTGDILEGHFTNDQWPTTIYEVQSATIDTVTVRDPYGYDASAWGGIARTASASGANVGQYVLQDRQLTNGVDSNEFNNCSGEIGFEHTIEDFNIGPFFDFASGFVPSIVQGGGYSGLAFNPLGGSPGCADYLRSAAILGYFGASGAGSIITRDFNLVNGNILLQPSLFQASNLWSSHHLQDWGPNNLGTNFLRPCVEIIDNGLITSCAGAIDDVQNSDNPIDDSHPNVYLAEVGGRFIVTNTAYVGVNPKSAYTLTDGPAQVLVLNDRRFWPLEPQSYQTQGKVGWWGTDQRLAGYRGDVQSLFGVTQGTGLVNCLNPDLTTWTAGGSDTIAAASGISTATLDGGTNGYRITGTGFLNAALVAAISPMAAADNFVFLAFVRGVAGAGLPVSVLFALFGSVDGQITDSYTPYAGDGNWIPIACVGRASAIQTTVFCGLVNQTGVPFDIAHATLLRLPAASYSQNDAFRIRDTFRPFSPYLPAGVAGTMAGVKLIGHAGLGVDTTVLTTPSGTASATKNLPLLKADGTIQGYIPVIPTNNSLPTGSGTVTSVTASSPLASSGGATPNITHLTSGVSAATYTNATVAVDADGHVTSASSGTAPVTSVGVTAPITSTGGATPTLALDYDNTSITLNGSSKLQRAALAGDVTASAGSNSVTVTAIHETSGPTKLTIAGIPNAAPNVIVLVRDGISANEIIGIPANALLVGETLHYFMNIASWPINQGWIATSDFANFYPSNTIEYPVQHTATTVTLVANLISNGLTTAGITAVVTQNGSNVIGCVFNMSGSTTPGVYSSGPITLLSSASTDTFGVVWSNSATGSAKCAFTVFIN